MTVLDPTPKTTMSRRSARRVFSWATTDYTASHYGVEQRQLFDVDVTPTVAEYRWVANALDEDDLGVFLRDVERIVENPSHDEALVELRQALNRWKKYAEDEVSLRDTAVARIAGGSRVVPAEEAIPEFQEDV